jgi:2-keto-3-deoxy-L-rhamnonate aldolase RhmA
VRDKESRIKENGDPMRSNKLRQLLSTGQPTLGTRLHNTWPSIVEVVGHTGLFDYVEFLAEYAPFDLYTLDGFCRAAELYDLSTMIKLDYEYQSSIVPRAISSGFQSVLFANCRTVEQVKQCIQLVRPETPQDGGHFGAVFSRFGYMNYGGSVEYVQVLRDLVVVLMIEKRQAVDNLEEILGLGGVDMIQWGPADYAMSIGRPGARGDPEIKSTERRVIETAQRVGIPARVELSSPEEAREYLDMGVRHFNLGIDLSILYTWLMRNGESLRNMIELG